MRAGALVIALMLTWASIVLAGETYLFPPSPPYCGPRFLAPDCIPWGIYGRETSEKATVSVVTSTPIYPDRVEYQVIKLSGDTFHSVSIEWWDWDDDRWFQIEVMSLTAVFAEELKAIFERIQDAANFTEQNAHIYWCTTDLADEEFCNYCELDRSIAGHWKADCKEQYPPAR